MTRLNKLINKFLDGYVGDGINVISNSQYNIHYNIYSNKRILIFSFFFNKDKDTYTIYRGLALCNMVSQYFSVSDDDAMRYIRTWFSDKHNMKKIADLKKFIPEIIINP